MLIANIHQAKTNLSKLIEATLAGEEVIIARAGKPVAKLITFVPKKKERVPGIWKGKVWMSDDFNDEDEKINKMFYSGSIFPEE